MTFPVGGDQRFNRTLELFGTATAYSEAVTASGALDIAVPVSIITSIGTATTVSTPYTLGTAPYEGFEKMIVTVQTATDSLGVSKITLSNPIGDPAVNVLNMEFSGAVKLTWVNDRWIPFAGLQSSGAAAVLATV